MHFLITAGATKEYIDPVRFISNASSGKMGYALARSALRRGHKVTLITCPVNLRKPEAARIVQVETAAQMLDVVRRDFLKSDCLIMAAAVSDYTVAKPFVNKMKKSAKNLTLQLKPTEDILKWAGKNKKKTQLVVGFCLEDRNLRTEAERKLREKKADMIIANTPAAIGAQRSSVEIKTPSEKWQSLPEGEKTAVANRIIQLIENLR